MTLARPLVTSWDALLAFSMLAALETQFRAGDVAIGPGEALLLVWMAPILVLESLRLRRRVPRPLWDVLRFWSAFTASLTLGVAVTLVREVPADWSLVAHDIFAYLLLAVLTCLLMMLCDHPGRLSRIQWMIVLFGIGLLLPQVASAEGWFSLPGIDPWYWDRMRGWSDNPNQFALFCALIGFLALALADAETGSGRRSLALACASIAFWSGFLSKSNAFLGVVVSGLAVFVLLKICRAFARLERQGRPVTALTLAAVSALCLSLCLVGPVIELRIDAQSAAGAVARDGASGGDEDAAMRVHLWKQAAKAGADSWGLGLGPGPHLEIPQSILAGRRGGNRPINLHHPKPGIAANFEAHNAVLELFVQGGLLAVLAFGLIVIVGLYRSWEAERDGVFALLFAVAAFGVFHVHFRHPLVWFAICLALTQHPRALKCGSAKPQAWPNGAPLRRIVLAPATRGPVRIATNASRGFW